MSTGYIEVVTIDKRKKPIRDVLVKIYNSINEREVLETTVTTNTNGKTGYIRLHAPTIAYSFHSLQVHCPYASYVIEVVKEGYMTEKRIGVQIFADCTSTLLIVMEEAIRSKRNTVWIGEHSLFNPQEESPCLRKS